MHVANTSIGKYIKKLLTVLMFFSDVGDLGAWGTWSACSKSCNAGIKTRQDLGSIGAIQNVTGRQNVEVQFCNTQRCNQTGKDCI